MTDILNASARSALMSRIRGRNTRPELAVRRFLHKAGLRFRLHSKKLPGRPDLVFPALRTALFVHGCFWHQHPGCPRAFMPKSNRTFWKQKLARNRQRDGERAAALKKMGWSVIVVWECQTGTDRLTRLARSLLLKRSRLSVRMPGLGVRATAPLRIRRINRGT
jgi:DNA mismatch endonuclease (patch repair protein)